MITIDLKYIKLCHFCKAFFYWSNMKFSTAKILNYNYLDQFRKPIMLIYINNR